MTLKEKYAAMLTVAFSLFYLYCREVCRVTRQTSQPVKEVVADFLDRLYPPLFS